jgi:DNA-binding transcriptional LysR family regulator
VFQAIAAKQLVGDDGSTVMMIARKYLYLIALAREKHFGRAAVACHISPSTLSAAISDLEAELGVAVVERGKQFTGLTPEGQCVVDYAQRMAAGEEGLRQELARLRHGLNGHLRVGVIPTALTVVASLTSAFARRHPLVTIEVLSLPTSHILTRLQDFEIDAGIIYVESGLAARHLLTVPLWHEHLVLLTPSGGPFEGRDSVTWLEAVQVPLCLLTPDMQNRKTIDAVFAQLECKARPTLESNSIISMLAHVCSGAWSAILPRRVLDQIGTPADVRVLPLVEPTVDWATGLVVPLREPRPPMIEALLAEALGLNDSFAKDE